METRVFRGPNYWSYEPAIKLIVDLGVLENFPSSTIPGFVDGLLDLVPGVGTHSCGTGKAGGFEKRLREGTWLGHVAEHVALQLQREAGTEVGRGKTRSTGERAATTSSTRSARRAWAWPPDGWPCGSSTTWSRPEPDFDFRIEFEKLVLLAERAAFGPSTQAILDEAALRDIPSIRLNEQSLVQLGHGVHQQRIRATMTSQTSSLGVDIASDKKLTNKLLAATGVPVPRSEVVRNDARGSRRRPPPSATRWRSSRSTATTAGASCSTWPMTTPCGPAMPPRGPSRGLAGWWSSPTSPATTTAAW